VRARRLRERIRVTVWNEFLHEREDPDIAGIYPEGIHGAIAKHLRGRPGLEVGTATMDEPKHGLTDEALSETDVLVWWGHMRHEEVSDAVVDRVHDRIIYGGMGLIVLHSAHFSRIFKRLMGTHCNLKWREAGERERLWVVAEGHPIAEGIGDYFEVEHAEMYGEPFGIPSPDELVFVSWFQGGEVFRSGCCFYRGMGKVFYFKPGHESHPIYHDPNVLRVIENAVRWAAPVERPRPVLGNVKPIEKLG